MTNGIVPVPDTSFRAATSQAIKITTLSLALAAMKPLFTSIVPVPDVSI
jgi:hypothetical protein